MCSTRYESRSKIRNFSKMIYHPAFITANAWTNSSRLSLLVISTNKELIMENFHCHHFDQWKSTVATVFVYTHHLSVKSTPQSTCPLGYLDSYKILILTYKALCKLAASYFKMTPSPYINSNSNRETNLYSRRTHNFATPYDFELETGTLSM